MAAAGRAAAAPVPPPTLDELTRIFAQKYGAGAELGWGPAMRLRAGYFNPDDHYEALLARLVTGETRWLDVGCGRELFPSNPALARELAARCRQLTGVDPDPTLAENPYVHERVRQPFEEFDGRNAYDLITLRMVAEHVRQPERLVAALARSAAPGALVVIYTVAGASPVPLLTRATPMFVRHRLKRLLWQTEPKDTFPTVFKMNGRRRLARLLAAGGFAEVGFFRLDDCRTLGRFRLGQRGELALRRLLGRLGASYPEACLLGVYRRGGSAAAPADGG